MGRKMSPVKTALIASCEKEGLVARKSDSIITLIHRLSKHEQAKEQAKEHATPIKKKPNAIKTLYSTPSNPLAASYKAHTFVEDKFAGDLSQAGPEWKVGAKDKIKLMIPEWRNTKGGNRMRWVLFK